MIRFILAITLALVSFSSYALQNPDVTALHLDWLDKSVDPTKNFYLYANGGWMKKNPIPKAYSR